MYNVEIITKSGCKIIRKYDLLSVAKREYIKDRIASNKMVVLKNEKGEVIDKW